MSEQILLPINEAMTRLGIKRTTFYALMKEGKVPFVHIGRRRLVAVRDLEDFVEGLRSGRKQAA